MIHFVDDFRVAGGAKDFEPHASLGDLLEAIWLKLSRKKSSTLMSFKFPRISHAVGPKPGEFTGWAFAADLFES